MNKKLLQEYFLFETHLHSNDASLCARANVWKWRDFYKLNYPWVKNIIFTNHSHSPGLYDSRIMTRSVPLNNYRTIKNPRAHSGLEVNILSNGEIDVDQSTQKRADWIMAALNPLRTEYEETKYVKQNPHDITHNYVKVIRSGNVDTVGHPTANVDPKSRKHVDWDKVFDIARESGVLIELNLLEENEEWWLKKLISSKCIISLGSDWHGFYHFRQIKPSHNLSNTEIAIWDKVRDSGRNGFDALSINEKEVYNSIYLKSPLGDQLYNWHSSELIKAVEFGLTKNMVINSMGTNFLSSYINSSKLKRRKIISQL